VKLKKRYINETKEGIDFFWIIKGTIIGYFISLICFLLVGAGLYFTHMSEGIIPTIVIIVYLVSIIVAGFYVARNTQSKGWLNGGIAGVFYIVILIILSYFFLPDFNLSLPLIGKLVLGFIIGAIGGIIGVNL
jgi:putative membrane protein (TIGR04086 family)